MAQSSEERRATVERFKHRLQQVIDQSGSSRAAFAERLGMDRSTLTQLLAEGNVRLPRAETVVAIASSCRVSADWLLGLSEVGQVGVDMVADTVSIETGAGSPLDQRLRRWQAEAVGYKIRYVPSTLPDLLRSETVIRYEYGAAPVPAESHIERAGEKLAWNRRPETDTEVCSPVQTMEEFARGEGIWRGLDRGARISQLQSMIELVHELYPTFRWFLFDGRRRFSAPFTVFGPLRAALYLGDRYLVLSGTSHVRSLIEHFDDLIRAAVVQPADTVSFLERQLTDARRSR